MLGSFKKKGKGFNFKYLITMILIGLFLPIILITIIFRFFFSNKKKL